MWEPHSLTTYVEMVIEVGVLASVTAPLLWLLVHRSFWSAYPRVAVRASGLLSVYAAFLAWLAISYPIVLRFLTIPAALLVLYEAWLSRPSYGQARRMPPGSLVPVPLFPVLDDQAYLKESARHGGVFKTSQFGIGGSPNPCPVFSWKQGIRAHLGIVHPMVCVVGLDRVIDVLRRFDDVLDAARRAIQSLRPRRLHPLHVGRAAPALPGALPHRVFRARRQGV